MQQTSAVGTTVIPGGAQILPAPSASELARIRRGDDEDGLADYYVSPFAGIEKSSVLQEASSSFNNPDVVKTQPQKCVSIITKLLFLLAQGEKFAGNEASDVFFAVTKLFQSQDLALRRMTYLFLKEVAEATLSEEIIIVTASLTKVRFFDTAT
jgi:coatomer protein complex subunit gamma